MSRTAGSRVVVLDRDGTIVVDRGYLDDPAQLEFLPGAAEGLRLMHERGHRIVIVTNQSGVGRGRFSLERLREINEEVVSMIQRAGAKLDALYSCPHRPDENCRCRKPKIGLLLDAAATLGFEPADAFVIGDKSSDIEFGRRAGATTLLISENGRSGDGEPSRADYVVRNLLEAASVIENVGRPCTS